MATLAKASKAELKATSIDHLLTFNKLSAGDTIHALSQYTGNSGTCYTRLFLVKDNDLIEITWHAGRAIDNPNRETRNARGIRTGGWGYSRAQHIVSHLSQVLFDDDQALKYREF